MQDGAWGKGEQGTGKRLTPTTGTDQGKRRGERTGIRSPFRSPHWSLDPFPLLQLAPSPFPFPGSQSLRTPRALLAQRRAALESGPASTAQTVDPDAGRHHVAMD